MNNAFSNYVYTTTHEYDRQGNLTETSKEAKYGMAWIVTNYQYEYDSLGNRTKQIVNGEVTKYHYDYFNLLQSSTTGNRTTTYYHDDNGNLISEKREDGSIIKEYSYDVENHLTYTTEYSSSRKILKSQDIKYNGNGQRIRKSSSSTTEGTKNTYYSYEGSSLLYATSQANAGIDEADIIYFNGIGMAEDQISVDQWTSYGYTKDSRGSTSNLISSSGSTIASYKYDDYGETQENVTLTGIHNKVMYTGQVYDEDSGQYYMNARYYDPGKARFITEDPIRDGYNWYAYCGNDPINRIDPTGLKSVIRKPYLSDQYPNFPSGGESDALKITLQKIK